MNRERKRSLFRGLTILLAAAAMVLGLTIPILAQGGPTGAILGFVKDPSGAVIPNANVEIINQGTGLVERKVTSGKDGTFQATLLPIGKYRLVVTAPAQAHFAKTEAGNVEVRVTETTPVVIELRPGAATETVEVTGVAAAVNTSNPTTGTVITGDSVANMPLVTRNFFQLLALSAGANSELGDSTALGRGKVSININGQRPTNNNYQLEGINANDFNLPILDNVPLPNPEVVGEFKTQTSLYDASQGRNGGGNVQVTMRSGTKNWHGNVYEFYRNDKFNANDWFLKRDQLGSGEPNRRPRLHQNQFGASLGGQLPIGRDWFVFGNYQGTRMTNAASNTGTQFTLSTLPILPTDRSAANLAATFGVPSVDPVALALLNLPASKCPGFNDGTFCIPSISGTPGLTAGSLNTGTITRALPGVFTEDQFSLTTDKQLGDKDKLSGRWFYSNFSRTLPFGGQSSLPFERDLPQQNRFAKLGWTHTVSGNAVNDFRFGFNRFLFLQSPKEPISLADLGQTRPNAGDFPAATRFNVSGLFSIGTNQNDDRGTFSNGFVYADDFSLTRGKHQLRFGGEVDQYQLNRFNNFATRGNVSFSSSGGFDAFQNFLRGFVTSTQAESGIARYYFRAMDYAAYFQDDWKIHPRLTLNLGLRWEFLSTAHDKRGFGNNFNFDARNNPPVQEIHPASFPGALATPGVPDCTLNDCTYKKGLAPRAGFAWDMFGNQKTVLRGGFGIYYQRTSNQSLLQTTGGLPFQIAVSAPGPGTVTEADPFPNLLPNSVFPLSFSDSIPILGAFCNSSGADPRGILASCTPGTALFNNVTASGKPTGSPFSGFFFQPVRTLVPPRSMQWNFTLQREVARDWMVEVGYVGTRGDNLLGPGRALNFSNICTLAAKCIIPNNIGSGVLVDPGTPDVVKLADGTLQITGSTFANRNARVPVEFLGTAENHFFLQENNSFSTYHSFQASLVHRFSNGLYFQGAYTFSKCLDNGSGSEFDDELNGLLDYADLSNPAANRGLCDFDRPHRFVASWNYELPIGRWMSIDNHGMGKIAHGWTVNGALVWQSGTPFNVIDSGAATLQDMGQNNDVNLAVFAPGATLATAFQPSAGCTPGSIDCFINLAAFTSDACVTSQNVPVSCSDPTAAGSAIGNVRRNSFRGPRQSNVDFSLIKNTPITESTSLQFRWEIFNLFNHPAFQSPQAAGAQFGNYGILDIAGGSSAIIGTANRPRIMQFAVKFSF